MTLSNESTGIGHRPILPSLESFEYVGHYEAGQFCLVNEDALHCRGVYVWTRDDGDKIVLLRVGMTWCKDGIGGRHRVHNRWLAGRFKPNDAREQAVRRFTIQGAGRGMVLLVYRTHSKTEARQIEQQLRNLYGSHLALDLRAKGSWISQQMKSWRSGRA